MFFLRNGTKRIFLVIKGYFKKKKSRGYYDPYLDQWVEYKKCNPDTDI
jgi:hypothetical protein